jgi:hypothetical protein
MASWQFDCALVPGPLTELSPEAALDLFREGSRELWSSDAAARFLRLLKSIEEPKSTWAASTSMIGVEDETCLTVALENDVIDEVRLRIDMRHPDSDLLKKIVEIARQCGLVFITENQELVESDLAILLRSAARSDAARFVADPERYLETIKTYTP